MDTALSANLPLYAMLTYFAVVVGIGVEEHRRGVAHDRLRTLEQDRTLPLAGDLHATRPGRLLIGVCRFDLRQDRQAQGGRPELLGSVEDLLFIDMDTEPPGPEPLGRRVVTLRGEAIP